MQLSDETKKELDSFLQTSLSTLTASITNGTEFVKGQAPELAREIVLFEGIIDNLISAGTSLLVIGILAYIAHVLQVNNVKDVGVAYGAMTVGAIVGLICFIACVTQAAKAWFAPKLFLLRYVTGLIRPEKKAE